MELYGARRIARRIANSTDIPHTVTTGRDSEVKGRRKRGEKNPHSQSWAESKAIPERKQKQASQGSQDPTAQNAAGSPSAQINADQNASVTNTVRTKPTTAVTNAMPTATSPKKR